MSEREPRWRQRERVRFRGGRRRSAGNAGKWRERESEPGGHPMLFQSAPAFDLGVMPEGGGYPVGFVEFAAQRMGIVLDAHLADVVHLCSGSVHATRTFDLRPDSDAECIADVRELPIRSGSVRWVMADPPYDHEYAEEIWGTGKQYPTPMVLLREAARILEPGGRVAFLHQLVPALPPLLRRVETYGICTGPGYRIRALTIAERVPDSDELDLGRRWA